MDSQIINTLTEGLAYLSRNDEIHEVELFAAVNGILTSRINYTSHLPCNGLEEPKSTQNQGIGLRVAFKEGDTIKVGFGQETGSFSMDALDSALIKAKQGAVYDPDFNGLPEPSREKRSLWNYHDESLLSLTDEDLVKLGWKAIHAALEEWDHSPLIQKYSLNELGLILGGDVTILQEEIALASSHP